ncbi:MAG: signal peptidase I [Lachnospiraceae bacterium]
MDSFTKKIIKAVVIYIVFAVLIIILFQTVLMLSLIPSSSMEPTIMTGDIVVSTRNINENNIKRFDILVFVPPDDPNITYIKRVVGLPGEIIELKDGKGYANGVELDSSFIKETQNTGADGVYEVPEGCYFFLGDNRGNSKDSRYWDNPYVPVENIQAKAKCIIFPFSDAGSLSYN